jgi:hypothetical protein
MTLLQANYFPTPAEQHRQVCTTGRKKSLEPQYGAGRGKRDGKYERSSETEIAR